MNSVELIGRPTKDPEVRYTSGNQQAIATFTLAVDRDGKKDENGNKLADFPRITVFGKEAEICEKYLKKGKLTAVQGRLQTGSYTNKNGDKVYTTDVIANRVEFLEWGNEQNQRNQQYQNPQQGQYQQQYQNQPQYSQYDEYDGPFNG